MLKDKEFIGRICRNTKTNNLTYLSVLKVIRCKENNILGFEVSTQNGNFSNSEIITKDDVEFQIDDSWMHSSDLIINLLQKKISTLRRQIKINTSQRNR